MGPSEFDEIAEIIVTTLRGTTPDTTPSGGVSKARYNVDSAITAVARSRVAGLLERHPLYPDIELDAR